MSVPRELASWGCLGARHRSTSRNPDAPFLFNRLQSYRTFGEEPFLQKIFYITPQARLLVFPLEHLRLKELGIHAAVALQSVAKTVANYRPPAKARNRQSGIESAEGCIRRSKGHDMSRRASQTMVLYFAGAALLLAILRYFMKGWLDPLGIPVVVGSFAASLTVVMFTALVVLFRREGLAPDGHYLHASLWFLLLAVWCEILVILGIEITDATGADTYYRGPWQTVMATFPTARQHAAGHVAGFVFRAGIGLLLGVAIYAWSTRRRIRAESSAQEPENQT